MEYDGLWVLTLNWLKYEHVPVNKLIPIYSFHRINLPTKLYSNDSLHSSSLGRSKVIVSLRERSVQLFLCPNILLNCTGSSLPRFILTDKDPLADRNFCSSMKKYPKKCHHFSRLSLPWSGTKPHHSVIMAVGSGFWLIWLWTSALPQVFAMTLDKLCGLLKSQLFNQ